MDWFADQESPPLRGAFSAVLVVTVGAGMLCATLHFADHWQFASFDNLFHVNLVASALTVLGGFLLAVYFLLRPLDTRGTRVRSNTRHQEQVESVRQLYSGFPAEDAAAIFVVRSGVDEQVIHKIKEQLREAIGIENLNYFRLE